jgi:hypothetical protein
MACLGVDRADSTEDTDGFLKNQIRPRSGWQPMTGPPEVTGPYVKGCVPKIVLIEPIGLRDRGFGGSLVRERLQ